MTLLIIMLLPTPSGLPVAGQCMLAILAFAVIVWMTEALDCAVSAVADGLLLTVIAFALVMLLGITYRRWLGYA